MPFRNTPILLGPAESTPYFLYEPRLKKANFEVRLSSFFGGPYRIRTGDLLVANEALSQLS